MYDIELAKAVAEDPKLTSNVMSYLTFLKRFYSVIYTQLSDYEIDQRFAQIMGFVASSSDLDGVKNIFQREF